MQQCLACQKNKNVAGKKVGGMKPLPMPEKPLDVLVLDASGPYCRSITNKYYIVNIVDQFNRYIFGMAVQAVDAKNIADVIYHFICRFTFPREIRTDLGPAMRSNLVKELTDKLNIQLRFSIAYQHQTNGMVERSFRTIVQMINCYTEKNNPRNWCQLIEPCCLSYNSTPHVATGVSPVEALFGVKSRLNLDLSLIPETADPMTVQDRVRNLEETRKLIRLKSVAAQERQQAEFEQSHKNIKYFPGEAVLIFDPNRKIGVTEKLRKKWDKEGVIVSEVVNQNGLYDVDMGGKIERFHISRLKKIFEPD